MPHQDDIWCLFRPLKRNGHDARHRASQRRARRLGRRAGRAAAAAVVVVVVRAAVGLAALAEQLRARTTVTAAWLRHSDPYAKPSSLSLAAVASRFCRVLYTNANRDQPATRARGRRRARRAAPRTWSGRDDVAHIRIWWRSPLGRNRQQRRRARRAERRARPLLLRGRRGVLLSGRKTPGNLLIRHTVCCHLEPLKRRNNLLLLLRGRRRVVAVAVRAAVGRRRRGGGGGGRRVAKARREPYEAARPQRREPGHVELPAVALRYVTVQYSTVQYSTVAAGARSRRVPTCPAVL